MSYVPPAGSAADVSWLGAQPYSPPLASGADVGWAAGARAAAGWSASAFGVPLGGSRSSVSVSGIEGTTFGQPGLRSSHSVLSVPPSCRFGLPSTPHDVAVLAAGAAASSLGRPYAQVVRERALNWVVQAHGAVTAGFGEPAAKWSRATVAAGLAPTQFGAGSASRKQAALGTKSSSFGAAGARQKISASGHLSTGFGSAAAGLRMAAVGVASAAFGTPERHVDHRAAPVVAGRRFGRPGASAGTARRTYSIFVGRRFGRPAARRLP